MRNPDQNSQENQETTPVETIDKPIDKTGNNSDNTTQKPDNQAHSELMAGMSITVKKPTQAGEGKPVSPFDVSGGGVVDMVSGKTEDAGDVVASLMDGDGSPLDQESAELVAEVLIEGTDTSLSFGGQLAVMEFNDDLDTRYSMSDKRKERLKKPLAKLLIKRSSKMSPEVSFTILAVIYTLPVIVKIVGDVIEKRKKAKEEAAAEEKKLASTHETNKDGSTKKAGSGGRPRNCDKCGKPETNKSNPGNACKC